MGSSGGKGGGGGQSYTGPDEADLAARRAVERAEAAKQRQQLRREALEDARRQQEADEKAQAAAKAQEAEELAAREAREEMVGEKPKLR